MDNSWALGERAAPRLERARRRAEDYALEPGRDAPARDTAPDRHSTRERRRWRDYVEEQIRDAQRRGVFRDLPGRGRPLDLEENPYQDASARTAHRLLQQRGFAPLWVEADKDVRSAMVELERYADVALEHAHRLLATAARRERLSAAAPRWVRAGAWLLGFVPSRWQRAYVVRGPDGQTLRQAARLYEAARGRLAAGYADLNREIDRFNLLAPMTALQRRRVRVERVLRAFDRRWRELSARYPESGDPG